MHDDLVKRLRAAAIMSEAVLISIQPKWCELIASGKKTIEVRKTRPNLETPYKCYIYCTKSRALQFWINPRYSYADDHSHNQFDRCGSGKVIGEFVCGRVFDIEFDEDEGYNETYTPLGFSDCLTDAEFDRYLCAKDGCGWHISALKIYDEPKKLSEFTGLRKIKFGYAPYEIKRPPQSWCYVEELA